MAFRMLRVGGPADIAALLRVDEVTGNGNVHEPNLVWAQTYYGVPLASTRQANVFADIRAASRTDSLKRCGRSSA
jgi:hypothetical protein